MQQSAALALARGIQANDPVAIAQLHLLDEAAIRHEGAREFLTLVAQMGEAERKAMFARMKEGVGHAVGRPIGEFTAHDGHGGSSPNPIHGLPSEVSLHPLSRVHALTRTDHWELHAEPYDHDKIIQGMSHHRITIAPRLPTEHHVAMPVNAWGKSNGYIDTRLAHIEPPEDPILRHRAVLNEGTGFTAEPEITDRPDVVWRGLSYGEMQSIRQTGQIQSVGEYNIGDPQVGLTYFSRTHRQARSYATGFVPQQFAPSFDRPSYIIGVKAPSLERVRAMPGVGEDEVGVIGATPASDIVEIHEARPYQIRPGEQELRVDGYSTSWEYPYTDGSGTGVSSTPAWRQVPLDEVFPPVQQELVLQAQSSRERYIHWLLDQKNGIGRPIGRPTHHEWLQPFTGPHGSLSGEHAAAAEQVRRSAGHATALIEHHTAWHSPAFQAHLGTHPEHSREQILEAFHGKVELKNGKKVKGPSFLAQSRAEERVRLKALESEHGLQPDSLLAIPAKDATTLQRYPHLPAGTGMLSVPGSVESYHPQMQIMLHDQMAYLGLHPEDMEAHLTAWMENALEPWDAPEDLAIEPDPLAHIEDNKNWYRHVFSWVSRQSDRFGISHDKILGATARLSPLRKWGRDDNPLKGDRAPSTNRGAIIALSSFIHSGTDVWITPYEHQEYLSSNESDLKTGKHRAWPPAEITLDPVRPTKVPQDLLTGHELASFTRLAHDDQGELIPLHKKNGAPVLDKHGNQVFTSGLGVVSVTGVAPVGVAISILRGDTTVDSAVNGPKIRTFSNNILNPDDPFLAVVDTWQYRALLLGPQGEALPVTSINPVTGLTETHTLPEWEKVSRPNAKTGKPEFPITPQSLFQSQPRLAPYATDVGVYPVFADVVRSVSARYNMSPSEVQASTWVAIQRNLRAAQGAMRQFYPDEPVVENPLDAI